jgi:hypothetical protein
LIAADGVVESLYAEVSEWELLEGRVVAYMSKGRIVKVECQCGQLLFKYFKGGKGRLIKCFLDEIENDLVGVVDEPLDARLTCPGCGKEIGIVRIVRGRPALKLNQGTIQKIRI